MRVTFSNFNFHFEIIFIAPAESTLTLDIIDLPDFKSNDLVSIEDSSAYPLFAEWIKADENALLNTTSLQDSATCEGIDTGRLPQEYDGTAAGAPGMTQPGMFGS